MSRFKKIAAFVATMAAAIAVLAVNPQQVKAYDSIAITQTGATTMSASIAWTAVAGADYYLVERSSIALAQTAATSGTITTTAPGTRMLIGVTAYKVDSSLSAGKRMLGYGNAWIVTKPEATSPVLTRWEAGTAKASLQWTYGSSSSLPDGYNVQVLDVKGKVIINTAMSTRYYELNSSKIKNKGFSIRVQPYYTGMKTADGKVYGDWTGYESYVPQPKVSGKKILNYYTRSKTVNMKWKKIAGAKSYTIYRSKSSSGSYKKCGTTKGTSFSQKMRTSDYYYYKIVANKVPVKVNGKTKKLTSYTKTFVNYTYA